MPDALPRPRGLEVEVQRPDGVRLSAEETTPALTALVQTFWEGR